MTDTTSTQPPRRTLRDRLAPLTGDGTVTLPEGALACRSCGVGVREPDPSRADPLLIYRAVLPGYPRDLPVPYDEVPLTWCNRCTARRATAEALLADHPRVRAEHGSVGVDRLDAALAALDVCGFRGTGDSMIGTLTATDDALRVTIARLAPIGASCSWGVRAIPGHAAGRRWSHVPAEQRRSAVDESRVLFRRQFESPALVPPPDDGARGCLICGVGHVRARPSDRARAWGQRFDWDVSHLGGRPRSERAIGYLCTADRLALRDNGNAIGVAVVERALLEHLGYLLLDGAHFTRDLGAAWITRPPGSEPNREPWGHLDLARIRRGLDRSVWVRRIPGREPR